MQLVLFIWFIL